MTITLSAKATRAHEAMHGIAVTMRVIRGPILSITMAPTRDPKMDVTEGRDARSRKEQQVILESVTPFSCDSLLSK